MLNSWRVVYQDSQLCQIKDYEVQIFGKKVCMYREVNDADCFVGYHSEIQNICK